MSLLLLLRPLNATTPQAFVSAGPFTEAQIRAGGQEIVITLTNDTWVGAGAPFNGVRQNIINGLNSAQSEALGWNNVVRALQGVSGVVRTSATEVTITLDAQATYDITANETITVTVPSTAVTSSTTLVGAPTFDVIAAPVVGGAPSGVKRRRRVRRADFSTQANYEAAIRAALLEADFIIGEDKPETVEAKPVIRQKKLVVTDTAIKVSPADMARLQRISEMEEVEMLKFFIKLIEDEWE